VDEPNHEAPLRRALGRAWRATRPEERFALAYALAAWALLTARGLPFSWLRMALEYSQFLIAILTVSAPIWLVAQLLRARRGRFAWSRARADVAGLVRPFAALLLVLVAYTNLKSRSAQIHPRLFDEALERLDAVVHFGGGDFIGWLLGFTHDAEISAIWSHVYLFAWLPLAIPFGVAFARAGAPAARRIATALALAYAAGSILYLLLPSLGPAFAFRPRFAHLAGTAAYQVQESMFGAYLWLLRHPDSAVVPFFGIAAMPSLHLATTALGILAAWRWCRPLVWLLVPWNLAIAWSALYFGWHYAIDFYPGLLRRGGLCDSLPLIHLQHSRTVALSLAKALSEPF